MSIKDNIDSMLVAQGQPTLSDDEIKEIEGLAEERQREIELETELETYIIDKILEED